MSQWSGLNRRPTLYESVALPTELHWRIVFKLAPPPNSSVLSFNYQDSYIGVYSEPGPLGPGC